MGERGKKREGGIEKGRAEPDFEMKDGEGRWQRLCAKYDDLLKDSSLPIVTRNTLAFAREKAKKEASSHERST